MRWKNNVLLIIAVIFFLVINTAYYWDTKVSSMLLPIYLLLAAIYLALVIVFVRQVFLAAIEKLSDKSRLITIGLLGIILVAVLIKPHGIIDFVRLEGKDRLVAYIEGVASCATTLKLKDNFTFKYRNVCFGVSEARGTYNIANDTIYFRQDGQRQQEAMKYTFAVVEKLERDAENKYALKLFKNKSDTVGFSFTIGKNELDIKPFLRN